MAKELAISVQTSGWYNPYFGGDKNPYDGAMAAKEWGFEGLDYNIDIKYPTDDIRAGKMSEFYAQDIDTLLDYFRPVKEAFDKAGIEVTQSHAPFPLYVEGFENSDELNANLIDSVEKCCAICQLMGCPAIVVHPWTFVADKKREREVNLAMYRKMIPFGKKYGVKLCLENMMGWSGYHRINGACSDVNEAVWYIDTLNAEAGEEIFGFCYDVGHACVTGNNMYNDIITLDKRLTVLHIHDNDHITDLHLAPYTVKASNHEYVINWDRLIKGLRDIKYRGPLNFETFMAIMKLPRPLAPAMFKYIASVGQYFRERILEGEDK